MRPLLSLTALFAASCGYVFDDSPPDLPLVGSPPPVASLKKYNRSPADDGGLVAGRDGSYWVYTHEGKSYHLTRLSEPEREEDLTADRIQIGFRAFYLFKFLLDPNRSEADGGTADAGVPPPNNSSTQLTVRSAGESPGATFEFPGANPLLVTGGGDSVFAYLNQDFYNIYYDYYYELVQRDGSTRRKICLALGRQYPDCYVKPGEFPPTVDAQAPRQDGGFFFNSNGTLFFDRYGDGSTVAHLTKEEKDYPPFQMKSGEFHYFDSLQSFVTCDKDTTKGDGIGVRLFHITDGSSSVLDVAPCSQVVAFSDTEVYFFSPAENGLFTLLAVPFAGGPHRVVLDRQISKLLAFGPNNQLLYSRDPSDRYIYGEGDGWLGDWRFMERGRLAGFSRDGNRLRWLEHATTFNAAGDLDSALIGGAAIRLARNVRQFTELGDGRVLAAADRAFRGVQNRIVAVDETAGVAQWVVDSATRYQFIPGSSDLLVEIVTGPLGVSDYVRVPVPPKILLPDGGTNGN
jgi:hypothetical protein